MIYFVLNPVNGRVKIGTSRDVEGRLQGLRAKHGKHLELMFAAEGGYREESMLHNRFQHLSTGGEWFKWTDEFEEYRKIAVPVQKAHHVGALVSDEQFQMLGHMAASKRLTLKSLVYTIISREINALTQEEKDDLTAERYREKYIGLMPDGWDRDSSGESGTVCVGSPEGEGCSGGTISEGSPDTLEGNSDDVCGSELSCEESESKMSNPTENWKFLPLGIGLEPKVIQKVTEIAKAEGRSRSEMIRTLIDEALALRLNELVSRSA